MTVSDSLTALSLSPRLCPWKVGLVVYENMTYTKLSNLGGNIQQVLNVILAAVKKIIDTYGVRCAPLPVSFGFSFLADSGCNSGLQSSCLFYFIFFVANDAHHHFTWLLVSLSGKVPTQFPDSFGGSSYYLVVNFPMWSPYKLSVRLNFWREVHFSFSFSLSFFFFFFF